MKQYLLNIKNKDNNDGAELIKKQEILLLLNNIDNILKNRGRVVVGIDGRCGSGKSTLGDMLAEIYDVDVIHMDDFFLPKRFRIEERLKEPGGNVHYERFNDEVAATVRNNKTIEYKKYSCRIMDYCGEVRIKNSKVIIIEGSYALHPLFNDMYDIKVFCDVDTDIQRQRIINRNGIDRYKDFESKWIPMEEKYFDSFDIRGISDYLINCR